MTHLKSPTDLGKYPLKELLNPFPANPMLIHKIQDAFTKIEAGKLLLGGMVGASIFAYGQAQPKVVIKFIHETYQHHPEQVIEVIGKETMKLIDEYMESSVKDIVDDIPVGLFTGHGKDYPESDCGSYSSY